MSRSLRVIHTFSLFRSFVVLKFYVLIAAHLLTVRPAYIFLSTTPPPSFSPGLSVALFYCGVYSTNKNSSTIHLQHSNSSYLTIKFFVCDENVVAAMVAAIAAATIITTTTTNANAFRTIQLDRVRLIHDGHRAPFEHMRSKQAYLPNSIC